MSFSKRVDNLTKEYERRMRGVFRQSVQDTVNTAQTVRPDGGRMRFDTGFLKASGGASLNRLPSGPSQGTGAPLSPSARLTGTSLTEALARWKPGDLVFWGWSANYARPREYKDGFMRGAAEKWKDTVNKNARKAAR